MNHRYGEPDRNYDQNVEPELLVTGGLIRKISLTTLIHCQHIKSHSAGQLF